MVEIPPCFKSTPAAPGTHPEWLKGIWVPPIPKNT